MTDPATRMRKSRERKRAGFRVLRVEVCIDTVEALIELDYLEVGSEHDFDAVSAALARFIEDTTDTVTCNAITLDAW